MAAEDVLDLSRYDSATPSDVTAVNDPDAADIIVNVEDPGCENKVAEAQRLGKGRGLYSWNYGDGAAAAVAGQQMADRLAQGGVSLTRGVAIDHEAAGIAPSSATAARVRAASLPQPFMLYTYLYMLNSQPELAAEWWQWTGRWIAYYPGNNDGSLPSWAIGDAQAWGAMIWQYTSTNGTRDRSTPVDRALWARWGTGTTSHQEDDDVAKVYISKQSDPSQGIWVTDGIWKRHVLPDEWRFVQYVTGGQQNVAGISDEWWDSLPTAAPNYSLTLQDLAAVQQVVVAGVKPLLAAVPGGGGGAAPTRFNVQLTVPQVQVAGVAVAA